MPDSIRRRVVAHGRVQGVFFRDSVQERASAEGVAGWVTNREDGAVEAVFEGDRASVDQLIDFMRSGPQSADVQDVEVSDEEPEGRSGFSVR